MLVNSIGYLRTNGVVAGVDTSKVQAMPVARHISKDFKYNSFTNNPQQEPETPVEKSEPKSFVGKLLNFIA